MSGLFSRILSFRKRRGTSGVAYALLSGLIAIGVIGSLTVLGNNTGGVFGVAGDAVSNASSGGSGSGGGSGGGSSNAAPTISDIADASIALDGTYGPTGFTISDAETAAGSLSVTSSSSDQTLVPDGNITLGGADGSRTITIVPAAGQSGSATITVTVDDGTDTAQDTFVLTVDDAPTISDISDVIISISSTSFGPQAFTVGDTDTALSTLTLSASSSNQAMVADGAISFGGSDANRTVSISTVSGNSGDSATITVTVDDGTSTAQDTFTITRNSLPTISDIADASIALDGTYGPVGFTVSDAETAAGSLMVKGISSNTTLVPNANITLGGSGGSRTITISPASGQSGSATITVTVNDGKNTADDTFVLTVSATPNCSGSLSAGDTCDLSGEEVVFVSNYDPGDGGGSRPLYAAHCDQGMTWNGSSCTGSRSVITWSDGSTELGASVDTSIPNDVFDDGKEFTDILVVEDSNGGTPGAQPHQAAVSCRGLGSEWFLPARGELSQIYSNRTVGDLNGTFDTSGSYPAGYYWSASENSSDNAWYVVFSAGSLGTEYKANSLSVRCVRR